MKHQLRRHVLGLAALAAPALALAPLPGLAQSAPPPLKLAAVGSVTGAGATIGVALVTAVKMAVQEINAKGGIAGRQVQVIVGDTQTDATAASNEARRLAYQEKVDAAIGPLVTQEIIPTVQVFSEAKIPQISTTGSSAVTPQLGPYHFSYMADGFTQGQAMADFAANTLKAKTVAILGDDGGQSKSITAAMKEYLPKIGLKLVGEQEYRFRTDDMTPQLFSLRRANPDAVFFITSTVEDTRKLVTTLKDIGWDPKIVGQLSIATMAPTIARTNGPGLFDNVYSQAFTGLTYCSTDPVGSGAFSEFKARLKAFAPDLDGKIPPQTALFYYDATYLMKAAIEGAGTTSGPAVEAWLLANAGKVTNLISGKGMSPSSNSHFLVGPTMLSIIEKPDQARSDGLQKRYGC